MSVRTILFRPSLVELHVACYMVPGNDTSAFCINAPAFRGASQTLTNVISIDSAALYTRNEYVDALLLIVVCAPNRRHRRSRKIRIVDPRRLLVFVLVVIIGYQASLFPLF